MLKHVPHLLEEKAGMQNDGNTDDNEDVQYIQHYKVLDKSSWSQLATVKEALVLLFWENRIWGWDRSKWVYGGNEQSNRLKLKD